MLHSGSRGPGARIANIFTRRAKAHMEKWHVELPDPNLAFLPEGEKDFSLYIEAMLWAQDFAKANRNAMMDAVIDVLGAAVHWRFDCHHNFAAKENHFDKNVWVTRKGATRARLDEYGIIPGSMGTGSFIVKGKGNRDSFTSCSHGAGRAMSRGDAMKTITLEDHCRAVEGIECRRDSEVLDESPAAYKDVSAVIAAQDDLISVQTRLRTLVNVKG
jgi:tRNA-splicing ligase RtcB